MLKPGDTFDRYTVESVLGQGGMGCVYQAHDARLDRRVALKIVVPEGDKPDPDLDTEAKVRMQREARAAAALDHPNVVAIHDIGEVEGIPYIAMELVTGRTLREHLGDAPAPFGEQLRWLLDVARALAAAHKAGLVHRDVKPENVMVRKDGRVKVLDFGIARRSAAEIDTSAPTMSPSIATLTAKGVQVGTPMYMAPEQIRGEPLDGRTDQFAWGVLAYELLTGNAPWKAREPLGLVADILTKEPAPLREGSQRIPAHVEKVVMRALSKAPADRFASMDDVVAALEAHVAGAPRPSSAQPAAPAPSGTSRGPAAVPAAPAPAQKTDFRRYSTQDMREIIQRALEREAEGQTSKFTYRELVEAAQEVGITEEALQAASRDLVPLKHADPVERDRDRLREKQKLLRHVAIYSVFSLFFFLLDVLTSGGVWFFYPMLGWGVGVASHAARYLFPVDPSPYRSRRSRRDKKRRHDRGRDESARDRQIEEGVSALLTATQQHARIAAPPDPAQARLRFDQSSAHADDEQVEEEQAPIRRRKPS